MNQILNPESDKISKDINITKKKKSFSKVYQIQFIISLLIACLFLSMYFIHMFKIRENEKIAQKLMGIYHVSTLYSENTDDIPQIANQTATSSQAPFVIGMLKIDKIRFKLPYSFSK